VQQNYKKKI